MANKYKIFTLSFAISFFCLRSQFGVFKNLSVNDGLSSSSVFSILEDKNGKMWFGTDNGLDCFVGNYREYYNNSNGLSGSSITSIAEYNNATWAFSKRKGIFRINQGNANEVISDTAKEYIGERLFIVNGNIISINRGVHLVIYQSALAIKKRTIIRGITDAFLSDNKCIVLKGASLYELKDTSLIKLPVVGLNANIYSYYAVSSNEFYLGGTSVIYRVVNLKVTDSIPISKKGFNIKGLCIDKNHNIWCSSLISDDNYIVTPLRKCVNIDSILGVKRLLITSIFKDSKNNIWLTTLNNGVYFFYNTFLENLLDNYGSPAYINRVINGKNGEVFLCTNFGLKLLNLKLNKTQQFKYLSENASTYVFDATISKDNYLFVGNNSVGGRVNSNYGETNYKDVNSTFFLCTAISNIIDNKVVFGAWGRSLYFMDINNKKDLLLRDSVELFKNNKRGVKTNRLFYSSNGTLWVGTSRGVGSYLNGKLQRHQEKWLDGEIYDIIERSNGTLVFCTEFGLVEWLNGKWTYKEKYFDRKFTNVRTAVEDSKRRLWFAVPEGLFCLSDTGIIHLNIFDGIISKQINSMCYNKEYNSVIIGTTSGVSILNLSYFDKEFILEKKIRISRVSVNNKKTGISDTLRLGTNERNLTIYLTSAEMIHTEDIVYQYKINSKDWVDIEGSSINFNNIPLPISNISFRGSNDRMNWSKPIAIIVIPKPFFWETQWFKIAIASTIFVVLMLIIFLNNRKNKMKLKYISQLNELRYEALMASINPHFIFNALNSIQSFINDNDTRNGSEYLAKFAQLIRLTIDHADQRYILLSKELKRIEYYLQLEQMRFEGKFDFKISCNNAIDQSLIFIPNMIIQPFVENSVIHAFDKIDQKGLLTLRIEQKLEYLQIEIEDNGIGIENSQKLPKNKHRSIGFSNVDARLKLLPGASLKVVDLYSIGSKGTLIRINFPIKDSIQ